MSVGDRVLVVCGGPLDRNSVLEAGLNTGVISNLSDIGESDWTPPFQWAYADVENLPFEDASFDVVIVHSGLHHCYSPHRAVAEMVRVASKVVIGFEPLDNCLTKIGVAFKYGQKYEIAAVSAHEGNAGGVANTEIPNFIYRFNKNDIRKIAFTLLPWTAPQIMFETALRVSFNRFDKLENALLKYSFRVFCSLIVPLSKLFPFLCNNIAFAINVQTTQPLHPWLFRDGHDTVKIRREYLTKLYPGHWKNIN